MLDILEKYVDEEEIVEWTLEETEESGNGFAAEATIMRLRQLRDKGV